MATIMQEFDGILKETEKLGKLLEARESLDQILNRSFNGSRKAARALGREVARFDVKYGPSKIDWDDLKRVADPSHDDQ